MRQAIRLHPDSRCAAVTQAEVEIARPRPGNLVLRYFVSGRIGDLRIPPVTAPIRADALWQNTCFEAFVKAPPGPVYYEFNFAPSMQWAAYRFSGYRNGMIVASEIAVPRIDVRSSAAYYTLQASLELDGLPGLPSDALWRLGLSAVIEEMSGRKSYWALAHPPGSADFHHSDCFTLELAAASRS
jgi:hypothetical protein